jgi:hypothetical protein
VSDAAILRSCETVEHYTTPRLVEPSRYVLGGIIDLDPASCEQANEIVRAEMIYTAADDGLHQPWGALDCPPSTVFLNPPGGRLNATTLKPVKAGRSIGAAAAWWRKLHQEIDLGHIHSAIVICFSFNIFRAAQVLNQPAPYRFPFVVPRDREKYWGPLVPIGEGDPQQDGAVVYIPPRETLMGVTKGARATGLARFQEAFSELGEVRL